MSTDFALRLHDMQRFFGKRDPVRALDGVHLDVDAGELLVLLGPSGCGKSTLLRCVAGLDRPTAGRIELGGQVVFDTSAGIHVPPHRRDYGMVFQGYALWPHMTVEQNVLYPLQARRVARAEARRRAAEVLEIVQCGHLRSRYPAELSGGQQQRVSLARALAPAPEILLFDEPLSSLDALLRRDMRMQLASIHRETGFSGIYVTHDQVEAFALGTRIAMMREGRIEQLDTPTGLYAAPATEYVAEFLGIRNAISVRHDAGRWSWEGRPFAGDEGMPELAPDDYRIFLWPESIIIQPAGQAAGPPGTAWLGDAVVAEELFCGSRYEYAVRLGEVTIYGHSQRHLQGCGPGAEVRVGFPSAEALIYRDGKLVGGESPSPSSAPGEAPAVPEGRLSPVER